MKFYFNETLPMNVSLWKINEWLRCRHTKENYVFFRQYNARLELFLFSGDRLERVSGDRTSDLRAVTINKSSCDQSGGKAFIYIWTVPCL